MSILRARRVQTFLFFFFNDTATTEIYTLSLHDALPISRVGGDYLRRRCIARRGCGGPRRAMRSEEHTSELQSHLNLVCRLLLEKKKKITTTTSIETDEMIWTSAALSDAPPPCPAYEGVD